MGIKSEGEIKMKKTIVLLLSLATIMGCVAAPVSALASSRNWKFSWENQFVGISMEKTVFKCDYKGSGKLKVGMVKNVDDPNSALYGGKTYNLPYRSNWTSGTWKSEWVAQSVGCNHGRAIFY